MDNIPNCQYDYGYEAPKPTIVDKCHMCGYDIMEGDTYYDIGGDIICDECLPLYVKYFRKDGEVR